jgi:hypothetical protein
MSLDLSCLFARDNSKTKEFEKYTEYLVLLMKSADFLKSLKFTPGLIQSYPGVLNIAELPI